MDKSKKIFGRPKLPGGKRTKFINVRFTDDEFLAIIEMEQQLGLSRTEIIRLRVLDKKILINARELIAHLDETGADMASIGNNINQLARHTNTLNLQNALDPQVVRKFNGLFEEYIAIQQQVEVSLRKIIRGMGM